MESLKPIYVLNGPNPNRLGTREPEIYRPAVEAMLRRLEAKH